jgi:hypothetical protein
MITEKEVVQAMVVDAEEWELKPEDQELRGFWIDLGSRMEKDGAWARIEWLVAERLGLVARGEGKNALYRDPRDGRLWELAHDHAGLKDGGPPRLSLLDAESATRRYGQVKNL